MISLEKVHVQTISNCSASCFFCSYLKSWHYRNPGRMSEKLFNKILGYLEDIDFKVFSPFLDNDPLLDQRIFKFISLFYDKFPDKHLELSTSPISLYKKNRVNLIKVLSDRNHSVLISFHGINEGTFKKLMGISFKVSLDNVISLINESDLRIVLKGVSRSLDGSMVFFYDEDYFKFWNEVFQIYDLRQDNVRVQIGQFYDRTIDPNISYRRRIDRDHPLQCSRINKVLHVLYNGDIIVCLMDYDKEIVLGNLNDISIKDFYNSNRFKELMDIALGIKESDDNFLCKKCIAPSV